MSTPNTTASGAAGLPEALRVPLDSLHADAGYLCGRLLNGSLTQEQVVESIRRRIDAAKLAALTAQAISAEPAGATEMENLQRTAVGWQERALRAERNWVVCRRWAIAGGAPVEKLGDDPDQPFHAASPAIEGESNV